VRERFDLIIVRESKSEQVGSLSRILLSGDEWENGLVVLTSAQWHSGLVV